MKTEKVFFDVENGKLVAEGVENCIVFDNQAKVTAEDGVFWLYSPEGKKVLSGFLYCYVLENGLCHVRFAQDKHCVYTLEGKCLIDEADDVLFYQHGWFTVLKFGNLSLYTPEGSLVAGNLESVEVTLDGKFAIAHDEDGYLALYDQKGRRYASGFVNFFGNGEMFLLNYVDKILVIDPSCFSETEMLDAYIRILKHKKLVGTSLFGKTLYDSKGDILLSGCADYEVYANGMYRGIDASQIRGCDKLHDELYGANGEVVQHGVIDVIEHENGCLEVLVKSGCHLYDSKGKHIAFLNNEEALGNCLEDNCYTLYENGKNVLYLADKTKVAEDVDNVEVYANGLILTEKENSCETTSVFNLYDAQGHSLCCSNEFLFVDGAYGYYVPNIEGIETLSVYQDGKEVLNNLSDVVFKGRLMMVECKDGRVLVYDMSLGLKEPLWQGQNSKNVVFCDLEEAFPVFGKKIFDF